MADEGPLAAWSRRPAAPPVPKPKLVVGVCEVCDWTLVDPTGDELTDSMLTVAHQAEHVDPDRAIKLARDMERAEAEYERGD